MITNISPDILIVLIGYFYSILQSNELIPFL